MTKSFIPSAVTSDKPTLFSNDPNLILIWKSTAYPILNPVKCINKRTNPKMKEKKLQNIPVQIL